MIRFGGVKSELIISSVCRVSQSMRKSGNAAIRLFLSFITDPISDIFVFESISILISVPPLDADPILRSGPSDDDRLPRLEIRPYISLSFVGFGCFRYVTISVVRVLFSISVVTFARGSQLVAFQVSLSVPRPDIALTSPSASDPSHLQKGIGLATTIQFHHWINGASHGGGTNPIAKAGQPIHIAVPIPSVRVGVTYIRIKLVGAQVQSIPHADGGQHAGQGIYPRGETGHAAGIQQGTKPHIICSQVNAEKVGNPADGDIKFGITGNPSIDGELHGARGAQLRGKLIHHPPPNQHERPSRRSCVALIIESAACGSKPILNSFPF